MKDKFILFDGWCNLCGSTVRFIQKYDHKHQFNFIPIQSDEGQELMKSSHINPLETDSVIYIEKGIAYIKSEAFFRIAKQLGGYFRLLSVFRIFPIRMSDLVYDVIAKNRYNWFGKKNSCQIKIHQSGT